MIKITEISDNQIWNKFIATINDYPFFQTLEWENIQKKLNHKTFKFDVYKDKNLESVFMLIKVHSKRGNYLYLRQGPVFRFPIESEMTSLYFKKIIQFSKELAKKEKVDFLRIGRFPENKDVFNILKENNFHKSAYQNAEAQVCWVLDLNKTEEELLREMRKSHRYLIKKSLSSDLKLIKTKKLSDLDKFMPLYKKLSERKHFIGHSGVKAEFEIFSKKDEEILYLVEFEGKIIAGALIAFVGSTAIYRHSASDNQYKNLPASYLIQWEAILDAKRRKKEIYNFWGIAPNDDKSHPWYGLSLFKMGFGGRKVNYLPIMDLPLKPKYALTYFFDFLSSKKINL